MFNTNKDPNAKEGMRIKLVSMIDDPNPIPKDTLGTISLIDDAGVIHVNWDNGRRLGVIPNVDDYVLEPDLENVFDKLSEGDFGPDVKKIVNAGKQPLPKIDTKPSSSVGNSLKKLGIKTNQVSKNARNAGIKVESEEDTDHMTSMGSVYGGHGPGITPTITGSGQPTFGKGPLTSKGIAKPGPLHPQKKKKKKVKENVFTKADLINEITDSWEVDWYDDTNKEPWADKNNDGWRWNDAPAYHKDGVIIDPLAKMKTAWDDENLDISKEWDKQQKLKKEDILRMVKNRLNETKIDLIDEEETIEETTTFGSVFPNSNFPVVPAFAAKQGQWRTAKKPIWKGGKIVQKVNNSGVLNPTITEANTVKYHKGGKFVKIKKKCTRFPYCSQGAVDNPLNISDKVNEPGTYVENFMKNVHEVAKQTGKSFQEVYQIVKDNLNN